MNGKPKLTPANIVIMASGAVIFIASFLAFNKLDQPTIDLGEGIRIGGSVSDSAWDNGYFLIATLPALLGLIMGAQIALTTFARNIAMPSRFLGMTWTQIHLALAFQALILMLAFLLQDNGPLDRGIGFWLMLLAAIGLFVGAIMRTREPAGTVY